VPGDEDKRPFELEPERERDPAGAPAGPPGRARPAAAREAGEREEGEVDERTVAERRGETRARGHEPVPLPPGWPREALTFPFARPGPALLIGATGVLVLLDLLFLVADVALAAWLGHLLAFAFLFRVQLHVTASSAAGRDAPEGWRRALDMDRLGHFLGVLGGVALALAPGAVLLLFGQPAVAVVLLVAGSMYASVLALGSALGDPTLKRPWTALAWMTRRPLACLGGALGWWLALGAVLAVHGLVPRGAGLVVFVSVVLRPVCAWGLLLSARALGVLGRSWDPG
jgi:hypothetical protein